MSDETSGQQTNVNIIPPDIHSATLLELVKGQTRLVALFDSQNERLFGGNGQPGALPTLYENQKELTRVVSQNKTELMNRIDGAKDELTKSIDVKKEKTDTDIDLCNKANANTEKKVTKVWTIGATAWAILGLIVGILAIYHH